MLGVAFYGYDWALNGPDEGISMRTALDRAAANGSTIAWDDTAKVPYYTYPGHIVYFENFLSIGTKLGLAAALHLSGVAIWRLGHEAPETWIVVGPYMERNGLASSAASPGR